MKIFRTQRFLCSPIKKNQSHVTLTGDTAHHLIRVLRFKVGDKIRVFDQSGYEWDAEIVAKKRQSVEVALSKRHQPDVESPVKITLLQSISKSKRMDMVMQKATELGVHKIVPMMSKNSVIRLNTKNTTRKMSHWKKITISASEQSGRVRLPVISEPQKLNQELLNRGVPLKLKIVHKDVDYIDEAMHLVKSNLGLGALLAVAVLLIFLGSARSLLIVAISIPVSLVSVFIVLKIFVNTEKKY